MANFSCIAAGDIFITRPLDPDAAEKQSSLAAITQGYDIRFANLEMTFHRLKGFPAAESGGTWAMADPERLEEVKGYGFNLFNTANNHSCDYGIGGCLATIEELKSRRMPFAGTGEDLETAAAPCYLELPQGTAALIGVSASFQKHAFAAPHGEFDNGRPGLNYLRISKRYHVTPDKFLALQEIADATSINAAKNYSIANGYSSPPPAGSFSFGGLDFVEDSSDYTECVLNRDDLERIRKAVRDARARADLVLLSLHAHAPAADGDQDRPDPAVEEFCRAMIDEGCDAVLGHGPHRLRGIEIYHGKPIFYSLGNFIFQTETVASQPAEAFLNKKLPVDAGVTALMNKRSKNGTAGLIVRPEIWQSVLAGFTMENGRLKEIKLYPLDLQQKGGRDRLGVPMPADTDAALQQLARLSRPYGTDIRIRNRIGSISL